MENRSMEAKTSIPVSLAIDPLGTDIRSAVAVAIEAGFFGIAVGNRHPELMAPNMSRTGLRQVCHLLQSRKLRLACIRGVSGRGGLFDAKMLGQNMESALAAIHLAYDLKAAGASLYIGAPKSGESKVPEAVLDVVRVLAQESDKAGVRLALSSESADFLAALITLLGAAHVSANVDSSRIALGGEDILAATDRLAGMIGIWTISDATRAGNAIRAVELGHGQLPLEAMLSRLTELNFNGELLVDVRDLANPRHAAINAAQVLRAALSSARRPETKR